jgi:hypothetical protein
VIIGHAADNIGPLWATKELGDSGCWARREPDGSIRFFDQKGGPLFAINSAAIPLAVLDRFTGLLERVDRSGCRRHPPV